MDRNNRETVQFYSSTLSSTNTGTYSSTYSGTFTRTVPIVNTKRAQSMMTPYQEECKVDADLQSMDNDLKTHVTTLSRSLADEGFSTSALKNVGDNVRNLNQISSDAVLGQCNAFGSKNLNSGDEESFNLLVDEYMKNSSQMLIFCSELDKFLEAARNTHTYIESETRKCFEKQTAMGEGEYMKITKKLKDLKASEDAYGLHSSTERLLAEVKRLRSQQEQMLENLTAQKEKLGEKRSRPSFWHKLSMTLFAVAGVGLVISMIVTAALATPAAAKDLGAAFAPMLSVADWITNWFEKYDQQVEINVPMQAGARVSIMELGEIQFLIEMVVNSIDSLLFSPNSTIEEQIDLAMKDIKHKLETFMKAIENLQNQNNICISEIRQARDKVKKKFSDTSRGWCSIL